MAKCVFELAYMCECRDDKGLSWRCATIVRGQSDLHSNQLKVNELKNACHGTLLSDR